MSGYVHLQGSEEVGRAARNMQSAADDYQRAVNQFTDAVERLRIVLDEHAARIERALEPKQ